MDASGEFKKQFPGEKIKSVSRASITSTPVQGKGGAGKINIARHGGVILSKTFVAFSFSPLIYHIAMALLAFLSLLVAIFLLLNPWTLLTFVAILLGLMVLALVEAFFFLEAKRSALLVFERPSAEISYSKEERTLAVTGIPLGSEWTGEKKCFKAVLDAGEEDLSI